jgi:thiosulfate/3-mercaptopyruvate sulfurtransferase
MRLPGLLVTPAWLSGHLKHPGVAVLDVRWSPSGGPTATQRAFEDGHIPNAAHLDLDRDLSGTPFAGGPGRHPLPDPEEFAAKMAARGVDDEIYVVAYDDVRGSVAARLWWMLWVTGHQVALLDGGLEAWQRDGGELEWGPPKPRDKALFTPNPWPSDRIATAGAVDSTIRTHTAPVLDARAAERYRGETEPYDPVAGHIPGSLSAPWTDNLNEDGTFRSPEELHARFEALGVTGDAAICSCGSGVTSCHDLFALRLAGFGDARLYEGSWSDWVHEGDRPVATGAEPG